MLPVSFAPHDAGVLLFGKLPRQCLCTGCVATPLTHKNKYRKKIRKEIFLQTLYGSFCIPISEKHFVSVSAEIKS